MFILFIIIINNKFKIDFKNKTFKWLYLLSKEIISTYFHKLIQYMGVHKNRLFDCENSINKKQN